MPRIFQVIKRVTVAGGAVSNRVSHRIGLALSQRIVVRVANLTAGVAVRVLTALRVPVRPSLAVSQRATGTMRMATAEGLAVRAPRAAVATAPTKEALDLVRVKYDLTQTKGANAQADTGTGTAWGLPANALGIHDGVLASRAGSVTVAIDRTLTLSYPDTVGKTALTIQTVTLNFYCNHSAALANSTMTLAWAKGGAFTTLATITASENNSVVPRSFDVTADIASWADLDALQTSVRVQHPAVTAIANNDTLDAVECIVVATLTDAI